MALYGLQRIANVLLSRWLRNILTFSKEKVRMFRKIKAIKNLVIMIDRKLPTKYHTEPR